MTPHRSSRMNDWPKKKWMDSAGRVYDRQVLAFETDTEEVRTPVLVYPADQAPEPVAWVGPLGQIMIDEIFRAWSAKYPNDGHEKYKPLYLAPPSESAIRAENDKLKDDNATQNSIIDQLEDRLGMVYGKEGDNLSRCENERDTLRELVREALAAKYMCIGIDWEERAEKALG